MHRSCRASDKCDEKIWNRLCPWSFLEQTNDRSAARALTPKRVPRTKRIGVRLVGSVQWADWLDLVYLLNIALLNILKLSMAIGTSHNTVYCLISKWGGEDNKARVRELLPVCSLQYTLESLSQCILQANRWANVFRWASGTTELTGTEDRMKARSVSLYAKEICILKLLNEIIMNCTLLKYLRRHQNIAEWNKKYL